MKKQLLFFCCAIMCIRAYAKNAETKIKHKTIRRITSKTLCVEETIQAIQEIHAKRKERGDYDH